MNAGRTYSFLSSEEARDAGLYTVRGSTEFVDLSTTDGIEYGVVSDFLALAGTEQAPILSVDSHEERYTSDFLGVLSIVRTKRTFKIARPWDESNKWKFGLTNPFWLDKQGIVIKSQLTRRPNPPIPRPEAGRAPLLTASRGRRGKAGLVAG